MSERWFRFHEGVINDPKVQRLPAEIFKTWVNLLCLASQQKERGILPEMTDDIAFALRMDGAECRRHLDALQKAGLIDVETGREVMHNFLGRQYDKPSDRPEATAQRQREARERQKEVTPATPRDVEVSHAPVTPMSRDIDRGYTEAEEYAEDTPPYPPEGEAASPLVVGGDEPPCLLDEPDVPAKQRRSAGARYRPKDFRRLYDLFPRHESLGDAEKAWDQMRLDEQEMNAIAAFIERAKSTLRWQRGSIPAFGPFLRQRRWLDDLSEYHRDYSNGNRNGKDNRNGHDGPAPLISKYQPNAHKYPT